MADKRSPVVYSLLSAAVVVFCFGVAEAVLRALDFPKPQGPPPSENSLLAPSPEYGWKARPGFRGVYANASVRVNAAGIRADREYAVAEAPGTYRVAALGNSCAFGYGVALEDCFTSKLEQMLASDNPDGGPAVEVINFGTPGHSTLQGLVRWREQVRAYRPDLLVLSYGWNNGGRFDILPDRRRLGPAGAAGWLHHLHLARALRQELKRLAGEALAARVRVGRRVPPGEFEESLRSLVGAAREDGIPVLLLILPRRENLTAGGAGEDPGGLFAKGDALRAAELLVLPDERRTLREWGEIAEPLVGEILPAHPPDRDAREVCRRAIQAAERGDAADAREALEEAWEEGGGDAIALYDLAVLHERLGHFATADSLFDLLLDRTRSATLQYQTIVRRVGRETGAPVLDFLWEFGGEEDAELYLDPGHPNAAGHTVIAREIAKVVRAEIRRGRELYRLAEE